MTSVYLLLLLIPVFAAIYIFWDYRRRTAQRDANTAERLQDVIGVAAQAPRFGQGLAANSSAGSAEAKDTGAIVSYVRRDRLLSAPQTLLYYLLKNELPDHLVFAQMTLASVLETAPGVADHARAEMARRLRDHKVDFVISDKRMHPVTVLKLNTPAEGARNELSSTQRWLSEAGVRYVEIDARALPRKEAIRSLALGEAGHAQKPEASTQIAG
ncbi:MAG: hypothetical protein JWN13_523 [Betaproteobacteria bacterium]|nr:hypothetical protein [Betaproteobacteria bacterium]